MFRHIALMAIGLGLAGAIPVRAQPAPLPNPLEERLAQAEKDLAALKERLDKRFRLMPSATLWLTSDHTLYRTAVPELYGKSLGWVIIHNGQRILQRAAGNDLKLDLFAIIPKKPGSYVVYLSAFLDGSSRPVSNVLAFAIDEPPGAEKVNPKTAKPAAQPSPPSSGKPAASPATPDQRLNRIDDSLSEFRAFLVQQPELRRKYTLWMDSRRVVYRDVGPEELEEDVAWKIGGAGQLGRNARGETAYRHYYQGPGEYTISVTSHGQSDLSNILTFTLPRPAGYKGKEDPDNDGL